VAATGASYMVGAQFGAQLGAAAGPVGIAVGAVIGYGVGHSMDETADNTRELGVGIGTPPSTTGTTSSDRQSAEHEVVWPGHPEPKLVNAYPVRSGGYLQGALTKQPGRAGASPCAYLAAIAYTWSAVTSSRAV
jgi:hypothetical protein